MQVYEQICSFYEQICSYIICERLDKLIQQNKNHKIKNYNPQKYIPPLLKVYLDKNIFLQLQDSINTKNIKSMQNTYDFFSSHIPMLEKYLLAKDKSAFIASITNYLDRKLLELLINPFSENYSKAFKQLKIPQKVQQQFKKVKIITQIRQQSNQQKKSLLLSRFAKQFSSNLNLVNSVPTQTIKFDKNQKHEWFQQSQQTSILRLPDQLGLLIEQQVKKDPTKFRYITQYGVKQLSQNYLLNLSLENKTFLIQHIQWLITFNDQFLIKFVIAVAQQMASINNNQFYQNISYDVLSQLTKQQINLIKRINKHIINNPNFIKVWFMVNYQQRIYQINPSERQMKPTFEYKKQHRRQILQIYQQLMGLKIPLLKSYTDQLLVQVLVMDIKLQKPNKQLFMKYLKSQQQLSSLLSITHRKSIKRTQYSKPLGEHLNLISQNYNADKIINQYLQILFIKENNAQKLKKQLNKFIDMNIVNRIHAKAKLAQAQEVQNLHQILTKEEIEQTKVSKEITILKQKTQSFFNVSDDVVLYLRLKNVNKLDIKIYQMNLQHYYLQNLQNELDQTISLLQMSPTIQQTIQINESKSEFQIINKQILLQKIPKLHGIYIVQLLSQGITSRAVIRKGSITCVQQNHQQGKLIKFYDQEANIIQNLKLWVNGRSYQLHNRQFLMPFGKYYQQLTIIVVKGKYAQKIPISITKQDYEFDIGLIYNHQSFIVGQKAQIILHPTLLLSDQKISLSKLQNIKVTTKLTNHMGIKSSIKYDKIKFHDKKDYILQIAIKQYTSQIMICVQCEIKNCQGIIVPLNFQKTISIDLLQSNTNLMDMYLKRTNQGKHNIIQLKGLNGEIYSNVQINLKIGIFGWGNKRQIKLKTNKHGKINLGTLDYVSSIKAIFFHTKQQAITRTWRFGNEVQSAGYLKQNQRNLYFHQDEDIYLPIPLNWNISTQNLNQFVSFFQITMKEFQFKQNKIDLLQVRRVDGITYLVAQRIKAGKYHLRFTKTNNLRVINVIKGKKLSNGCIFNQKSHTLLKFNPNPYVFITMGQLKEQTIQNQDYIKLIIPISCPQKYIKHIQSKYLRFHIFLKNYHDSQDRQTKQSLSLSSLNKKQTAQLTDLNIPKSNIYNNKYLSDQQSYILNRQNQKQFIGNNLQKPRIFLNRISVRDTKLIEENLDKQGNYQRLAGPTRHGCRRPQSNPQSYNKDQIKFGLNSHNNFISNPEHSILNIKYQQLIQITVPKGYSQVVVYLLSNQSCNKKTFYLQDAKKSANKDLRNEGLVESDQKSGWSISREVYPMLKGQIKQLSHSSSWRTVSLSSVIQFALLKGHKLPSYLTQWSNLSLQKKLSLYDKQYCHQLNIFLKYQDNQFFINYVKPFISNKITRTFVDMVLVGDANWQNYTKVHMIQSLNQFQKILLIQCMMQNDMTIQAGQIANTMMLKAQSNQISFSQYKQLFDTILNSEVDSTTKKIPRIPLVACKVARKSAPVIQPQKRKTQKPSQSDEQMSEQQDYDNSYQQQQNDQDLGYDEQQSQQHEQIVQKQQVLKLGFKQVQKTKQYTQITYSGLIEPSLSRSLVPVRLFWSQLAVYLTSPNPSLCRLLSQSFIYLQSALQFTLACIFNQGSLNSDYQLKSKQNNFVVEANNSFLVFVRQIKNFQYQQKFGVLINQRFINPQDRFFYQDNGVKMEKKVKQFLIKKVYSLQTVVTNTSASNLQLQILIDIPSGAIPLQSHQFVKIININMKAYSTLCLERLFYFPQQGCYKLYPANANHSNTIISRATPQPVIIVERIASENKMQSLLDIITCGTHKQILEFIQKKNIYDKNVFNVQSIYQMLQDKQFFASLIKILTKRNFFHQNVWSFAFQHQHQQAILQYIQYKYNYSLKPVDIPIFQYFPYYSTRTHKFMNNSKSTIRNVQFKETYRNFIVSTIIQKSWGSSQKLAFSYYLILQDRIDQCYQIFSSLSVSQVSLHELQCNYLSCYLSMLRDYPTFTKAFAISQRYKSYPILKWQKMFSQIYRTLQQYQNQDVDVQKQDNNDWIGQFTTKLINQGSELRIMVPKDVRVELYFYKINLELYFSDHLFQTQYPISLIKPKITKVYQQGNSRQQKIQYQELAHLKDMIVQVYQFREQLPATRINSLFWSNPKIRVKFNQNHGNLQVFFAGKKQSGCYVKVYSKGQKGIQFYRDGYTDITGTFKYVLAGLDQIERFSILTITKQGGQINQVNPPEKSDYY